MTSDPDLFRDPDRYSHSDKAIIEIFDESTKENIAIFHHDGSLHPPDIGQIINLRHFNLLDEESEGEVNVKIKESDSNDIGKYTVSDVSHEYSLIEFVDDDGDAADVMIGTIRILVNSHPQDDD